MFKSKLLKIHTHTQNIQDSGTVEDSDTDLDNNIASSSRTQSLLKRKQQRIKSKPCRLCIFVIELNLLLRIIRLVAGFTTIMLRGPNFCFSRLQVVMYCF